MLNENSSVVKTKNSIESSIDGEVVLMNLDNNEYYAMDETGSMIWKMLDKPVLIKDIVRALMEDYEVEQQTCLQDTVQFLQQLLDKKIIEVAR